MIPSHENSEFYLTKEVTKIGITKTDEKTDQNVRSGSGQLMLKAKHDLHKKKR
jgi:hypothetical protein